VNHVRPCLSISYLGTDPSQYHKGSLTAAPVAGARGSYDSDDGHEVGRLGAAIARRAVPYRGEHRQATERAPADIEGHSEAAEYGELRRLSASANIRASEMKEAAD
jgi:hypothetical protein